MQTPQSFHSPTSEACPVAEQVHEREGSPLRAYQRARGLRIAVWGTVVAVFAVWAIGYQLPLTCNPPSPSVAPPPSGLTSGTPNVAVDR